MTPYKGGFASYDMEPPFDTWLELEVRRLYKLCVMHHKQGNRATARLLARQALNRADVLINGCDPHELKYWGR